ncbi:MMPL family transporter [Streptomyces sp. NPDC001393]
MPSADLVLTLTPPRGQSIDASAVHAEADNAVRVLARHAGVRSVRSYWATREQTLRSRDSRSGAIYVELKGSLTERARSAAQLLPKIRSQTPGATVQISGEAWTAEQVDDQVSADLMRAEATSAPLVMLVLLVAYGSLVSALLPVGLASITLLCGLPVVGLLARITDVSVFAVNAAAAIGFGLAVDYTLFLLARYREEMRRGRPDGTALALSLQTAGRSVLFSAATVMVCLTAALAVPLPLLRGLALSGIVVTGLAAIGALVLLPACLTLLGARVEAGDPLHRWRRSDSGAGSTFWRATAHRVCRRPLRYGGAAALVLTMMALPFQQARLGTSDERTLPPTSAAATAAAQFQEGFSVRPDRSITIVLTKLRNGPADPLPSYSTSISRLPGVTAVQVLPQRSPSTGTAVVLVQTSYSPGSEHADELVAAVRSLPVPAHVLVGGAAALSADTGMAVKKALPAVALILCCGLWLLLGAHTRSLVAPVKALAVGLVSLGAGLGVLVAVFQHGLLANQLGGFTITGSLDSALLLFTLLVAFALSLDYEVFLLGRIREEYDMSEDNHSAVVEGISRTGRLMTSAALAVACSTAALAGSSVTALKLVGLGTAVTVLVDATLVRGVLVPAVMTVLGPANWWQPWRKGARTRRLPLQSHCQRDLASASEVPGADP